jgi:rare lipoprotein A (RlpA)-like double-psi beta-barrel protein
MLAAAGKNLPERFGVCARAFGPWLTIAMGLVVAITMFGCSQQPVPQYEYSAPVPSRISPSVRPPGRLEVASWYGPGFVGHVTSDGETFNPNELTAASKTLPIGSRVRVTNPENGRSVVVRINDRGPYVKGRNLDLSHSAAQKIGLCAEGVGHVRVRVLRSTKNGRPNRARDGSREHI